MRRVEYHKVGRDMKAGVGALWKSLPGIFCHIPADFAVARQRVIAASEQKS